MKKLIAIIILVFGFLVQANSSSRVSTIIPPLMPLSGISYTDPFWGGEMQDRLTVIIGNQEKHVPFHYNVLYGRVNMGGHYLICPIFVDFKFCYYLSGGQAQLDEREYWPESQHYFSTETLHALARKIYEYHKNAGLNFVFEEDPS